MAEGVQSGPERSRARSLRRQRTLDGEDRSATIPPGRKGSGCLDFWSFLCSCFAPKSQAVATLPSALFRERLLRSVQVGCSGFSRCCHLIVDLGFHLAMEAGPGHRRSHRNSALGRGVSDSMNLNYAAAGNRTGRLLRSGS
jgi:hypothetical protein